MLIRKHSRIEVEDDMKGFLKYFGSFFNEFKKGKVCLYYLVFIGRRLGIVAVFVLVSEQIVQLALMAALSTGVKFI